MYFANSLLDQPKNMAVISSNVRQVRKLKDTLTMNAFHNLGCHTGCRCPIIAIPQQDIILSIP